VVVRSRRWIAVVAAALALHAVLGFLVAPRVLQRTLPGRLEEQLGRAIRIERIRTNPFTLSVQMDGFAVLDVDRATPALSWRSAFVDFELWPLVKREQRFRTIRLVDPAVRGGLRRDGTPSFADVAERLRKREEARSPEERRKAAEARPWTIVIDRLDVEGALIAFSDASRGRPFEKTIGPVTLHLESFRTTSDGQSPYTATGETDAGERFEWTGTLRVAPLRSTGTLVIDDVAVSKYAPYTADLLRAELRGGRVSVRATYALDVGVNRVVRLLDGELRVRDVALHDPAGGEPILTIPSLDVTGIRLDAVARQAHVARVESSRGVLSVRRDGRGELNLARVLAPSEPAAEPFAYEVGAIGLDGWRIELDDRMPPRPVQLAAGDVALRVERLRSASGAEAPVTATVGWPGGGTLRVEGTVTPSRPAADLRIEADALALAPLDPYLELYGGVRGRLTGGAARGSLRVSIDLAQPERPAYALGGDAALDGLVLLDDAGQEAARWRALEAKGIDARSDPPALELAVLRVLEPRLRVIKRPDATTNLAALAGPAGSRGAAPQGAPAASARAAAPEPTSFRIGTVAVERGRVTVTDATVTPAAIVRYTGLRAKLTNLSSNATARTSVDVEALVEGTAPVRIAGTLNPRLVGDVTDVTVRSKGIDLTPFGPYSGRYMGYALERGKLDVDMRYRVKHRRLRATNVVRVDQLALGSKTDSPDAPSFPMGLALAVLTDRHGVMKLDVPIEGNLDDPDFKLGRIVWQAILNVLGKVALAPFAALGRLVGGGDDAKLDTVEFAAGSAELAPSAVEKLGTLAKVLQERPGLNVEVEGMADDTADGAALRRDAVRALAAREKAPPRNGGVASVTDEEYPRYLMLAYERALRTPPAPQPEVQQRAVAEGANVASAATPVRTATAARATPSGKQRAPTPEEMEALLLTRVDVATALRDLSAERAATVREHLVASGVDQARLFLADGGGKADEASPSVRFKMK
jgi:hypothetical protein